MESILLSSGTQSSVKKSPINYREEKRRAKGRREGRHPSAFQTSHACTYRTDK